MDGFLRFLRMYEIGVYLVLGVGGCIFLRKFFLAWQELRDAAFGLERESAQIKLNRAAGELVVVLFLMIAEFSLVSFVAPNVPGATPLLTSTLDLLATPTITLVAQGTGLAGENLTAAATQALDTTTPGCVPGQVEISEPADGSEISGIAEIKGSAFITDFGFYKLEMKTPDQTDWLTILAGNETKQDASLGSWNTSLLTPGEYNLSLVVVDNQGQSLPGCIIKVRVTSANATAQP
jgi:hypothetical protein